MWVGLLVSDLFINNAPSLELAFKAHHHCSTYSEPVHFTGSPREPAGFHLLAVWLFQLPEFLIWPTHRSLLKETGGTQGPAVLLGDVTRALKHRLSKCALRLASSVASSLSLYVWASCSEAGNWTLLSDGVLD
ncbi:uncharacterized protein LOC116553336 [Sapajus apella]|uniref:Uncharacterized protein LOC116553336 n=1 Tax=Sapajus apella TaxID=9515 RepID=A0A6J3I3Y2_SAPAP|nr:uncharacterized protein LOC116553336 [Sapajus apella]